MHVLAIRWGLVRPYCDGASLLSCRGIPTLRSVSLLLTMELARNLGDIGYLCVADTQIHCALEEVITHDRYDGH